MTAPNIASHLPVTARRRPHAPAVVFPESRDRKGGVTYTRCTFSQLDERSDLIARGLLAAGIRPGDRAVLMVTPGLDFFALTFALFKAGIVMVGVDPGIGVRSLGQCLGEAEPRAFLGIGKAHLARRLFGWAKKSIEFNIFVGGKASRRGKANYSLADIRLLGEGSASAALMEKRGDDEAAILFTSGSTGPPKGVVYSHANFGAQVEALKSVYGIEPGEIDLCTFPLFALFAPALGMTAVIPEMDFTRPGSVNPERIFEGIENFGATNMFGSPALLRRVGEYGSERGVKLPSLRRVISAGAPVHDSVIESFATLLGEGVEIFTPYGATESLPVASIGSAEILSETAARTAAGVGICVGRPAGEIEIGIIAVSDEPIERWSADLLLGSGEIGEIVVRGPVVTGRYYGRPRDTALAKIPGPDGTFRHRMGDLGYLDGEGRLWFCGRKSQRVRLEGGDMFTIPCEAIFNSHDRVFRSALVGVTRKGRTIPAICVELQPDSRSSGRGKIRDELLELARGNPLTADIREVFFHPAFPVDIRHNAKIDRGKLAAWAEKKLS
jgi:acyl-CoA synthetase (AMP-forming)/AMP-acid ligase II